MGFFSWLESSKLALWIGESLWGYPIALTCHAVGMAIMVGLVAVVDLRVAGFFKVVSMDSIRKALTVAWWGFALNVASGFSLFSSQATYFITHKAFIVKLIAIILAAINAYMLQRMLRANSTSWDANGVATGKAKMLAISSLLLWLTAVIAGRLIAYV